MKKEEIMTIGEIDFSDALLTEAEIGRPSLSSLGLCKIELRNNEGPLAHFHVFGVRDKKFKCCICIYSPHYFNHSGYTGQLNAAQREALDTWLRSYDDGAKETYWEYIERSWYTMNPDNKKYRPEANLRIQPDYTKLQNYRSR